MLVTGAEVLVAKLLLPEYTAVIVCDPVFSEVVAHDALPPRSNETETLPFVLSGALPRTVVPSMKLMVPVGVGVGALTVAIKVTDDPSSSVLVLCVRVTIVATAPTTWLNGAEVAEL